MERGLTDEQIQLFLLACESTSVSEINDEVLALATVMGGKEAQQKIDKAMSTKRQALNAALVRMTINDGKQS